MPHRYRLRLHFGKQLLELFIRQVRALLSCGFVEEQNRFDNIAGRIIYRLDDLGFRSANYLSRHVRFSYDTCSIA